MSTGEPTVRELAPLVAKACTGKQADVMALLAADYSVHQIAGILGISRASVRDRRDSGLRKMRAAHRANL